MFFLLSVFQIEFITQFIQQRTKQTNKNPENKTQQHKNKITQKNKTKQNKNKLNQTKTNKQTKTKIQKNQKTKQTKEMNGNKKQNEIQNQ